jgi:hypothetical protein
MRWSNCFSVDRLDRRRHRCCGADRRAAHHHHRQTRQTRRDEGHGVRLQGSGDAEAR